MKSKKAAMEMSVGTIVTIVLLMSVLVLGLFLVQNIFKSAKGAVDLTDQQLQSEIEKLFSDDSTRLVLYPTSKTITIKIGDNDAVGVGIRNIIEQVGQEDESFSYEIKAAGDNCGLGERADGLIALGATRDNIQIVPGELRTVRATFQIPEGVPICLITYDLAVERDGVTYATDEFTLEIKA